MIIRTALAVLAGTLLVAPSAFAADPLKDACNAEAQITKEQDKAQDSSEKAETSAEFQLETAACYEVYAEALEICPGTNQKLAKECIKELKTEVKLCLDGAKVSNKAEQGIDKEESKARKELAKEKKQECLQAGDL